MLRGALSPAASLEVATRIGRRLCRDAIWDHDCCTWLGWQPPNESADMVPVYGACGGGFYDGTAGIGCFLQHLSQASPDPLVRLTADGAVRQAIGIDTAAIPIFPGSRRPQGSHRTTVVDALAVLRWSLKETESVGEGGICNEEIRHAAQLLIDHLGFSLQQSWLPASMFDGWCGVADALLLYECHNPNAGAKSVVEAVAAKAYTVHEQWGIPWPCGGPGGAETPDLLHGLAGIGWCYLRLADPLAVPSPFALVAGRENAPEGDK